MKKIIVTFIVVVLALSCFAQKKEEKLVRQTFQKYKLAILNDKGEDAVEYIDSRTVTYYSEILKKTINADSATVNSLGLIDKVMVFTLRHTASKEELLALDGKGLLVFAIKRGMVGKNSVINNTIGGVEIAEGFAKGKLVVKGKETPFHYEFYKEGGVWKIDLTSIFSVGEDAFDKIIKGSELGENEFLFMLLEMKSGKKPGEEIWKVIK